MASKKQIKKRVSSIKNIGKITSALGMVSASRVQKAQDKALAARPYADKIYELISSLAGEKDIKDISLLRQPETVNNDLFVLISTNKGLVGNLNLALFGALTKNFDDLPHKFITLGSKGRNFAIKNGLLIADFSDKEPFVANVPAIAEIVTSLFIEKEVDSVYLAYSSFVNVTLQIPTIKLLLPIGKKDYVTHKKVSYSYEPSVNDVLSSLLVFYIENQIREAIISAEASEHASRMIAMKNASENANELSNLLSLEYNKARQEAITAEIADVVTSTESLS